MNAPGRDVGRDGRYLWFLPERRGVGGGVEVAPPSSSSCRADFDDIAEAVSVLLRQTVEPAVKC